MEFKFTVPGQPFGKLNMQPIRIGGHASLCNPKGNVEYMGIVISTIQHMFNTQYDLDLPIFKVDTPLFVTIVAYFPLPKVCYGKKGISKKGVSMLSGDILPTKKPDCDNISKIICDAITKSGFIWHDDSQIVGEIILKRYDRIPRVEVTVESK